MAGFESAVYTISAKSVEISRFLSVPSNLYEILPHDRIEGWQADEHGCSFKIKGLAPVGLKLESHDANSIVYRSTTSKPFEFKLVIHVNETGDKSQLQASFDADVNNFMSMMLKTPLTNFLNSLGEAIQQKYSAG